jgi:hypothetical protein
MENPRNEWFINLTCHQKVSHSLILLHSAYILTSLHLIEDALHYLAIPKDKRTRMVQGILREKSLLYNFYCSMLLQLFYLITSYCCGSFIVPN